MKNALFLIPVLMVSLPALAADGQKSIIKHMRVAPPAPAAQENAETPAPATSADPLPALAAAPPSPETRKPLTIAEALRKPEDLKVWSLTADTIILPTDGAVDGAVKNVEADPGAVPPQALLFLARALAGKNRMEEAALYFYAAQIRLGFDMVRWPPRLDPEQIKALLAEKKKSADQQLELPEADVQNPHQNLAALANQISQPITRWMLADIDRAHKVLARVKAWDESVPYAYLPGYPVPEAVAFSDWEALLAKVRTNFYAQTEQILALMKDVKK